MRLPALCSGLIIALCSPAAGQIRVAGRVTNETNSPIAGARVTLEDIPSTKIFQAVSDPTGAFLLQLPVSGEYSLKVDREGFYVVAGRSVMVPAKPAEEPPFELHLALQSIHEIRSSIEVKGDPGMIDMDRVTPQTTLSGRTLYDVPFPNQNNLRSGLRMIPGVVQDSTGGVHLFGGSEEQAQYSFEGFQLNDPLTGRFDARMSLESVQSVDVQPSPSGAEIGRGAAGTMLLHARTGGDQLKYSATNVFPGINIGQGLRVANWTPRGNISGPWKKGRAWFSNTTELQFVRNTVPQLPASQNSSKSWRFNNLLHNQVNLSEKNILFVGLLFNYWYAPRNGISFLDPPETTVNRRSTQWFGYVKNQHSFSRSSLIEFGFAASLTHSSEVPQGSAPYVITPNGRLGNNYATAHRDAQRQQGLVNYYLPSFQWFGRHQLKTGADVVRLDFEQNISRSGIIYLNDAGGIVRATSFSGPGRLSVANYESAVYVQDSWRVRPWLLVEMGWRADGDHVLHRMNSSPRAGFAISPPGMDGTRISGGFARIIDPTNLRLFTRPLDQSAISTYFDASGNVLYGPIMSVFSLGSNLKNPHADVWNLGAERSLPKLLQTRLQLLRRRSSRGFTYENNLSAAYQLPSILAGSRNPGPFTVDYVLTNQRQDEYDSVEISLRQPLKGRYEWMVSYTRSRAVSSAVVERTIDQPLSVTANSGPLPWDAPNRLLSWGYLPAWGRSWAIAYMLDWHSGLPFSVQDPYGQLAGTVDDHRFRQFFELNLFLERQLSVRGYRVALRGGFNNITGHSNPNVVDNVLGAPTFLRQYGGQARALNFRLRFLGHR
ncbi:MAG: carboxypeptidase regulatory-like domain-containing protein [Candidatus Solibacter sp.]